MCDENKMRYKVELYDKLLNKLVNVSDNIEYPFYKMKTDSLVENRFELLFTEIKTPETKIVDLVKNDIRIYPNPSNDGNIRIISDSRSSIQNLEIFTISGQRVLSFGTRSALY